MPGKYKQTLRACYLGLVTQAININLAPLFFVIFHDQFGLSFEMLGRLVLLNFTTQLAVELAALKFVDRIGYRASVIIAHSLSCLGIIGLGILPRLVSNSTLALAASVLTLACGGGIMEVVISPIVESLPTEAKAASMSLLHSFYCWGHVGVVLLSTAFFALFGISNWKILACIWAIVPFANLVYFTQVPLYPIVDGDKGLSVKALFSKRIFWFFMLLMVCAGASEQAMSQWSSAFAESGLKVSKATGDLAGPCTFAVLMGTARAVYGKYSDHLPLKKVMIISSVLCIVSYSLAALTGNAVLAFIGCALCGFSVGIFWPGTFSIAVKRLPTGGTAMYALMALAGDFGCSAGPTLVGFVASANDGRLSAGLSAAMIFPVLMLAGLMTLKKARNTG